MMRLLPALALLLTSCMAPTFDPDPIVEMCESDAFSAIFGKYRDKDMRFGNIIHPDSNYRKIEALGGGRYLLDSLASLRPWPKDGDYEDLSKAEMVFEHYRCVVRRRGTGVLDAPPYRYVVISFELD